MSCQPRITAALVQLLRRRANAKPHPLRCDIHYPQLFLEKKIEDASMAKWQLTKSAEPEAYRWPRVALRTLVVFNRLTNRIQDKEELAWRGNLAEHVHLFENF